MKTRICIAGILALLIVAALSATSLFSVVAATIPIDSTLSQAIDLDERPIMAIEMPAAWTEANLTFLGSVDNVTFSSVYTADGTEFSVTAAASRLIVLNPEDFQWARYIKLRSGTAGTPVTQAATRQMRVLLRATQ